MTPDDPNSAAAVIGSVVAAISGIILAAWKGGFFKTDAAKGDAIREELRELHAKLDKMSDKMDAARDRLTQVESTARELARRVDRVDR